jgi:hypothetical protein
MNRRQTTNLATKLRPAYEGLRQLYGLALISSGQWAGAWCGVWMLEDVCSYVRLQRWSSQATLYTEIFFDKSRMFVGALRSEINITAVDNVKLAYDPWRQINWIYTSVYTATHVDGFIAGDPTELDRCPLSDAERGCEKTTKPIIIPTRLTSQYFCSKLPLGMEARLLLSWIICISYRILFFFYSLSPGDGIKFIKQAYQQRRFIERIYGRSN